MNNFEKMISDLMESKVDKKTRKLNLTQFKPNGFCYNCGKTIRVGKYCKSFNDTCREEFYDKYNFQRLSDKLTKEIGKCEKCSEKYDLESHHIVSVKDGGRIFDRKNLMVLCEECHKEKRKIKRIND